MRLGCGQGDEDTDKEGARASSRSGEKIQDQELFRVWWESEGDGGHVPTKGIC